LLFYIPKNITTINIIFVNTENKKFSKINVVLIPAEYNNFVFIKRIKIREDYIAINFAIFFYKNKNKKEINKVNFFFILKKEVYF
jgi:hypothetical protein